MTICSAGRGIKDGETPKANWHLLWNQKRLKIHVNHWFRKRTIRWSYTNLLWRNKLKQLHLCQSYLTFVRCSAEHTFPHNAHSKKDCWIWLKMCTSFTNNKKMLLCMRMWRFKLTEWASLSPHFIMKTKEQEPSGGIMPHFHIHSCVLMALLLN